MQMTLWAELSSGAMIFLPLCILETLIYAVLHPVMYNHYFEDTYC